MSNMAKPTHILDFSEYLFQEVMDLFNVKLDEKPVDPRLANRQKSKKFVTLPQLHKFLRERLDMTSEKVSELIEKIDNRNKEKITWTEFLLFVNKEAEKREVINDASIYGCGTKRFIEKPRKRAFANGQPINYGIDFFLKMELNYNTIYLMIFENYTVGLFNTTTKNYDEFLRMKFPSDYSKPRHPPELEEEEQADPFRDSRNQGNDSLYASMKKTKVRGKRPSTRGPINRRTSKSIKGIETKNSKKYRFEDSSTTLNKFNKAGRPAHKLTSKVSIRTSDKSFEMSRVEEKSVASREYPLSKKYTTVSKKDQFDKFERESVQATKPKIRKNNANTRIYGILGIERLNPDDNILMRGNINSKKENSLSIATTKISKTKMKEAKQKFINDMSIMDSKISENEKKLQRIREAKGGYGSNRKSKKSIVEEYDPYKFNIHHRIQNFRHRMDDTSYSIFKLKDEITHISSVGDPWTLYGRGKRTGTASIRRRPREDSLKILDPQAYK